MRFALAFCLGFAASEAIRWFRERRRRRRVVVFFDGAGGFDEKPRADAGGA